MTSQRKLVVVVATGLAFSMGAELAIGQSGPRGGGGAPSSSLVAVQIASDEQAPAGVVGEEVHLLREVSMIAVAPEEPRSFKKHDLIQIIVREASRATSDHELEAKKKYIVAGKVGAWPNLTLQDLINFQMFAGRTDELPKLDVEIGNKFVGEGEYERRDNLTARLTAEVIEVLPNGNLVLEARTFIKTDDEEANLTVTGVCRPSDVMAGNTILSNQIHDLKIKKVHKGELKRANSKGFIAKALDLLFAF